MSRNLVKSQQVVLKDDATRLIDSNDLIEQRLSALRAIMDMEGDSEAVFTEGLNALQLDQLMSDPEAETEDIVSYEEQLQNARAECEMMLTEAREEAERIIAQANSDAASIREQAKNEGHSEGYEAGYLEGAKEADSLRAEAEAMKEQYAADYEAQLSNMEPRMVEVLTGIYDSVLHVDLKGRNGIILMLLKDAIREIDGGKNFMVHVSSKDYQEVLDNKDELMMGMAQNCTLEVIEDYTLHENEGFIEAEGGIFDVSLGTQLANLKKELTLMSGGAME